MTIINALKLALQLNNEEIFKRFATKSFISNQYNDAPSGTIITFIGNAPPEKYLKCDGSEYNIQDYPYLAEHFKTQFGSYNYFGGDNITTFAVPNLMSETTSILYCIKY